MSIAAFDSLATTLGLKHVGFEVRIPQLLPKTLNSREHWRVKAKRVKGERQSVAMFLLRHEPPKLPVLVTLTRCAPRTLDDDNCVGAYKSVRDEVASWLGIDDADKRVTFVVAQQKATKVNAGTLIRVESRK